MGTPAAAGTLEAAEMLAAEGSQATGTPAKAVAKTAAGTPLKGLSYEGPRPVFKFFGGNSDFWLKFSVNAKTTPIAYVIRLILYLDSRQAYCTDALMFYEQPIRGSIRFV